MNDYSTISKSICEYCNLSYSKGLVVAHSGNISVRLSSELILTTPTLFSKQRLEPRDLVICDMNSNVLDGYNKPSSEIGTHLAIYSTNSDINAIIHTHPPYLCSYLYEGKLPNRDISFESQYWLKDLLLVPQFEPGSSSLSDFILSNKEKKALLYLLIKHGLFACGKSLQEAWWRTEIMENCSMINHLIDSRNING